MKLRLRLAAGPAGEPRPQPRGRPCLLSSPRLGLIFERLCPGRCRSVDDSKGIYLALDQAFGEQSLNGDLDGLR